LRHVNALGWNACAAPAVRVEPVGGKRVSGRYAAVLLTSGQALSGLPEGLDRGLPVFAVGAATARRARAAGFADVHSAEGTARDLEHDLRARRPVPAGTLLLLTGQGLGLDLAARLRAAGHRVVRRVVYRVVPQRAVRGMDAADDVAAVLFFSAGTARAFVAALTPRMRAGLRGARAVCISAGTADVLAAEGWAGIVTAARPDAQGVLEALGARQAGD